MVLVIGCPCMAIMICESRSRNFVRWLVSLEHSTWYRQERLKSAVFICCIYKFLVLNSITDVPAYFSAAGEHFSRALEEN